MSEAGLGHFDRCCEGCRTFLSGMWSVLPWPVLAFRWLDPVRWSVLWTSPHPASAPSRHPALWPRWSREVTRSPWLVSCHIDMALDTKSQMLPGATMEILR